MQINVRAILNIHYSQGGKVNAAGPMTNLKVDEHLITNHIFLFYLADCDLISLSSVAASDATRISSESSRHQQNY